MQRMIRLEPLWQDKDIRFDAPSSELQLRSGEKAVEVYPKVEDTKGNSGEVGKLIVTNLRLIWQSISKPRINLSIGFNNITAIENRAIHTKLRGKNEALHLMTKVGGTRYEFIFIRLEPVMGVSREMIELIGVVCRAFTQTKLFRELRLRSAIMSAGSRQLRVMPSESIYNIVQGVWNLSSDQGNLGTMFLTNVRIVWHANMNDLFNISLPYIQIRNIKVRESKFGVALVIESSEASGGYVLGFRLDPIEKLNAVFEELYNLFVAHSLNPDFGVHSYLYELLKTLGANSSNKLSIMMATILRKQIDMGIDNGNIVSSEGANGNTFGVGKAKQQNLATYEELIKETDDTKGMKTSGFSDPIAAYLAEGESRDGSHKNGIQNWVYMPELGLSVERIKDGYTLESLWEIVEK